MDVWPLPSGGAVDNPLQRDVASLICSVGTPRFEDAFFQSAREATGCAHLTAFALADDGRPKILLALNAGPSRIARSAGEAYVARYWHMDPVNRLCDQAPATKTGFLARALGDELRRSSFRRSCYSMNDWSASGARMIERVSLIRRQGGETVKISFHRDQTAGPFHDIELSNIAASADLLVPLVQRHGLSSAPTASGSAHALYLRAVIATAPDLSSREAAVCAGIVLGMTSEGIASYLGISLNTVRTYRKRAYARLAISSQNELMKLVMPSPIVA
jgi:DNA-binding CsgD family transcriptional regulator